MMKAVLAPVLAGLIMIAAPCRAAFGDEPDRFRNPTAGFEVTRPAGWQYITAAQARENLEATKLGDDEFRAAMLKYATVPMVAMMKHPEPFDDVNPSFKVNIKPLGSMAGRPPVEILGVLLPQLENVFRDFEVVQAPVETEVSGLAAGYARVHYTLETADGSMFPCASELWIVPRGAYFFLIGAGTRLDEATGSRSEIREILDSVSIEH